MTAESGQTLTFIMDPRLDGAAARSAAEWEAAARTAGVSRTTAWLVRRCDDPEATRALEEAVEQLLASKEPDELAEARVELAELIEGGDDLLAETLLQAAATYAVEIADGEMLAAISGQLATIAQRQGDLLTAAEYHVEFLNWRRQTGHVSDPEDVQLSFDEIIRYAEADEEPTASALFAYRQAAFTRLAETDDDRAAEGDWERDGAPYRGWL